MFSIFLTHLKRFLDNLMCHLYKMFTIILKKIIYYKKRHDLDARFWIQRCLLNKNFKK